MKKGLRRKYDGKKRGWFRQFKEFLLILAAMILLFRTGIGVSHVKGNSMRPTLENGETALYIRLVSSYERGDIVALRLPSGERYVKRIAAVEGDTVDLQDGKLLINGEEQQETYVLGETRAQGTDVEYPCTLNSDCFFVLGDNREDSTDSRTFGTVVRSELKGKVIFYLGVIKR